MEAASTSETSVNFYQTTRRNKPEDSHFSTLKLTGKKNTILVFIKSTLTFQTIGILQRIYGIS
jgi:hypothetical protein